MATRSGEGDDGWLVGAVLIAAVLLAAIVFAKPLQGAMWSMLRMEANVVAVAAPLMPQAQRERFERWHARLSQPPPETMNSNAVLTALNYGGKWLRWPFGVLCVGLGIWIIQRSPVLRYTRTLSYETLLLEQAKTFVRRRPVLWLKGRLKASERGNYTRAQSPYEWAATTGVIKPGTHPQATEESWNGDQAHAAFAAQLGKALPDDPKALSDAFAYHERLMFAALALRILDRKKDSDTLLDGIAIGFGPNWSRQTALWQRLRGRQHDWPATGPWVIRLTAKEQSLVASALAAVPESKEMQALLAQHAHPRVLLAVMLERAQAVHGILTSSDFIWIKAVDRALHYTLNDVGRRVATSEAAGIRAHLQAEREAGERIKAPQVAEAVRALSIYLEETSWEPPPLFVPSESHPSTHPKSAKTVHATQTTHSCTARTW